jgi:hypothetical protein
MNGSCSPLPCSCRNFCMARDISLSSCISSLLFFSLAAACFYANGNTPRDQGEYKYIRTKGTT